MRVIIEVISGPSSGRKSVMGAFQTLQIGRTEWADFSIPQDGRMSSVHFSLETDADACYLKDLGSRNGTILNGQQLADRVALRPNDEITAGDTIFRVQIERDTASSLPVHEKKFPDAQNFPAVSAVANNTPLATGIPPLALEPRPAKRGKVSYTFETCASGLILCGGSIAEIRPTDVANLLSVKIPLHLIIDLRKIDPKPELPPAAVEYLFGWIPPEAVALASPVVVSAAQLPDWPMLLEQGWGNDAVICFFSRYDKPSLMEHLRHCLRTKPKQEDLSAGIVGYCWPGVMSILLANGMHNFVKNFFTGIEAVLVELPDLPEVWQLYGPNSMVKLIDDLGFVRKDVDVAKAK